MANAFGGFLHTSPLSNLTSSTSRPPDPHAALASNCIRDHLGPIAQTVADALHSRGPSTLAELISAIRVRCLRDWNSERGRLVDGLNSRVAVVDGGDSGNVNGNGNDDDDDDDDDGDGAPHHRRTPRDVGGRASMNKARGSESAGYVTDTSHVRSALVALLHHSLVKVYGGGGGKGGDDDDDDDDGTATARRRKPDPTSPSTHYTYAFLPEKARLLMRHSRYVMHARDALGEEASEVVECLLLGGRMTAEDAIWGAHESARRRRAQQSNDGGDGGGEGIIDIDDGGEGGGDDEALLRSIALTFCKLVEGGYVEMVRPIATNRELEGMRKGNEQRTPDDGIRGGEYEFGMGEDGTIVVGEGGGNDKKKRPTARGGGGTTSDRPTKKQRVSVRPDGHASNGGIDDDGGKEKKGRDDDDDDNPHPRILSLLSSYRKLVPPGSVYRANAPMFHASLRASAMGRLVSEMYPDEGGCVGGATDKAGGGGGDGGDAMRHAAGAVVKAALTYAARQEHAPLDRILGINESEEERHNRMAEWGTFAPPDIVPHLPPEIVVSLQSQMGGLNQNLSALLLRMSKLRYPPVLIEVEDAIGHPRGGKFEVCTRQLLCRVRDRIQHRVLSSHHGLVAARVVSVLRNRGHAESDVVAEDAMVPAREAREVLHRLHRDRYVDLFDMHVTKTHNTGTAIFLWDVMPSRLSKAVFDNVCTALLNLRLRRQHEVEVGKDWMDRVKESGATEENFHEADMRKFRKFCMGLDRLDRVVMSLDETLMFFKDF